MVRFLKRIIDCGVCRGIDVSVCGEMAAEPLSTLLLLGLGSVLLDRTPGPQAVAFTPAQIQALSPVLRRGDTLG